MNNHITPHEVFSDVRKAYRLLHDYQRMVMDAVAYIGKQLTLDHQEGFPKYSSKTKYGRDSLQRWAWDWLGMMFYEFHFTKEININNSETPALLRLSALHAADTDALRMPRSNRPDTSTYPPSNLSNSKICFIFSLEGAGPKSWKSWDFSFADNPKELAKLFEDGSLPERCQDIGLKTHLIDVADICSEEQAIQVAQDLKLKLIDGNTLISQDLFDLK
ncbi:hypothetical protein JIN77_02605 [Verrucomicrobiaceae bacterium R5-34]|nr:hypothetical protein [Verrucomicrobiaceae bacterium R5-34]